MKTIGEAIQATTRCLDGVGIENARQESEFLLAACLQVPRTHLILHRQERLSAEKIRAVQRWLNQRQKRKPLAYVSGEQPFRDLCLKVSPAVLIPRPETELLVEQAFRVLERISRPVVAADVGTGSGAIALSLSAHPNVARVIAIDSSPEALRVARANGKENQRAPVEWIQGDLLEPLLKRHVHRISWSPICPMSDLPTCTGWSRSCIGNRSPRWMAERTVSVLFDPAPGSPQKFFAQEVGSFSKSAQTKHYPSPVFWNGRATGPTFRSSGILPDSRALSSADERNSKWIF